LGLSNFDSETGNNKKERAEEVGAPLLASAFAVFVIILFLVNYRPYKQNITLAQGINNQKEGISKNISLLESAVNYGPTGEFESLEQMNRLAFDILSSDKVTDQDKNNFGLATLKVLTNMRDTHPNDVRAYINLGSFLADVGLFDDAIPTLEKAKELSPKKQQIYFSLAKAYFLKGDKEKDQKYTDKALQTLKYAYELAPQFDTPKLIYAQSLVVTDHIADAVEIAKTMESPADFVTPGIVKVLVEKGHANDAIVVLELAIKSNPTNMTLYTLISDIYTFQRNKAKAIEWLRALEKAVPATKDEVEQSILKVNSSF
jgi:tetratricopeptide (TPR) repeat protein